MDREIETIGWMYERIGITVVISECDRLRHNKMILNVIKMMTINKDHKI